MAYNEGLFCTTILNLSTGRVQYPLSSDTCIVNIFAFSLLTESIVLFLKPIPLDFETLDILVELFCSYCT